MTQTRQQPLGSGFTAASTADEVLAGLDLTGRTVVVTGGHAGLGLQTTRSLAAAGASVTVGSRDPRRAAAALAAAGVAGIEVGQLDLVDPASIDAFVDRYLDSGRPLHILVNNAGISSRERVLDARGYELTFVTNHLGHFQLTQGLLPALRKANGARVVNVSSGAHRLTDIRWDDPHFATGYHPGLAYGQSKAANVLFAVELDRRWSGDGVRGYALHPGISISPDWDGGGMFSADELRQMGLVDDAGVPIIDPEHEKKTPQQAAATIVFAAASPLLADLGGVYLRNSDVASVDATPWSPTDPVMRTDAAPHALDPASARRLWDLSERMLTPADDR